MSKKIQTILATFKKNLNLSDMYLRYYFFFSSEKYQTNKTIPDYKTMLALSFR